MLLTDERQGRGVRDIWDRMRVHDPSHGHAGRFDGHKAAIVVGQP